MDHFTFEEGAGKYKKNSGTAFAEEIKIMHSSAKQRNILQTSEIKFIQSFQSRKKFLQEKKLPSSPPPTPS